MNSDSNQTSLADISLILASASPRRRWLLALLGIPFRVCVAEVDEQARVAEPPDKLAARLSHDKALAVARSIPYAAVLGADTVVALEGEVLGKPANTAEATDMLRRLRDRAHQVYSGVTLCPPHTTSDPLPAHSGDLSRFPYSPLPGERGRGVGGEGIVVESTVWMRPYSDAEIAAYVASGDPFDKAGAYAIQNRDFHPVARLKGCYTNVMGLPLCEVARLLARIAGCSGDFRFLDVQAACSQIPLPPGLEGTACCCTDPYGCCDCSSDLSCFPQCQASP